MQNPRVYLHRLAETHAVSEDAASSLVFLLEVLRLLDERVPHELDALGLMWLQHAHQTLLDRDEFFARFVVIVQHELL